MEIERARRNGCHGARERERVKEGGGEERKRGENDENGARQKRRGSKKRGARSEKSGGWEASKGSEDEGKKRGIERDRERGRVEAAGFLSRHRRRHPTKIDPVRVPRPPRTGRVCVCSTGYTRRAIEAFLLARDMLGLQWRQRVFRPRSLSPPLFFFHFFFRSPYLAFVHRVTLLLVHGPNTETRPERTESETSLMGAGER